MNRSAGSPDDLRVLSGNERLSLDGPQGWLVKAGSVAIFTLPYSGGVGMRRYLCSVGAGEAVLWVSSQKTRSFTAVPLEHTELVPVSLMDEAARVAAGHPEATRRVERWIENLASDLRLAGVEIPARLTQGQTRTADGVLKELDAFHQSLLAALDVIDRRQEDDRRRRFDERQRLDVRLARDTMENLASITSAERPRDAVVGDESPLLAAARRVGAACGIVVRPPPDAAGTRNALESILDASGARSRKVLLSNGWWRRDGGPLLGFLIDGELPVALIPEPRSWLRAPGYRLVSREISVIVDDAVAATVAPTAFVFYTPLPDRASFLELLRAAVWPQKRAVVTAVLAGVATALVGMLAPQATKIVFEYAVPDADRNQLILVGVALAAAAGGALLFDLAQGISVLRLTTTTAATLQVGVWDRVLRLAPSFFRRFTAGDLENRAEAVTRIRFLLNETTLSTWLSAVVSLLNLGLMFYYSRSLAWITVAIAAVAVVVNVAGARVIAAIVRPLQEIDGQLTGLTLQLINAVGKLTTARAETRAFAQWARVYIQRVTLMLQLQVASDRIRLFGVLLAPLTTAALYWVAYNDLFGGGSDLTLGTFIAFSVTSGTFLAAATTLGDSAAIFLNAAAMWKRLTPILREEAEVRALQNNPGPLSGRVRLEHVTFRYREDGPLTLEDVSITAEAGECVAIVGPSGSGKSTIVNLLLRFETPASGAVYYDNHDLRGLDVLAVRRQLGVVTQENRILAGSVYENISGGSLSTMDEAWEAARAAGFEEDIRQMPMGMHTYVAEGGGNISGGQRQRLLIARALLQKPRVVIFDEATSALDNRTQAVVTESLNALKATRLIVAHRLSTIRQANRIYVLQAGRIVQQGTFDELMAQDGLFARSMQRQVV